MLINQRDKMTRLNGVITRVAYRGGSSHFFSISILRYLICSVSVFFGQYSRCVGKISSFMVPPSKNIYYP
jgi:hypothetical protein